MNQKLKLGSIAVGAMDAVTGILLIFFPQWTLQLMRIHHIDAASMVYMSWIGTFVFSIGFFYFLVLGREANECVMIWRCTMWARLFVASFVLWKVKTVALEMAWITVAVTDFCVASLQWCGIKKLWWYQ